MPTEPHSVSGVPEGGDDSGKRDTGKPVSRLVFSDCRLKSDGYKDVFSERKSCVGQTVIVKFRIRPEATGCFGVTTAKRFIPTAVDRSRARRLMREAFRMCRANLRNDADLVLVARPGIVGKDAESVRADFEKVCRRAKLWAGS